QVTFPGRPVDLAFAEDGRIVVVKNINNLVFIDAATGKIRQTLRLSLNPRSKLGFSVVGLLVVGDLVFASDTDNHVQLAERQQDGKYVWREPIALAKPEVGGLAHPAGISRPNKQDIWVAATRSNCVQRIRY